MTDKLFILACKSKDYMNEVKNVYKTHYHSDCEDIYIAGVLEIIVSKYNIITVSKLLNEMNPTTDCRYDCDGTYWSKAVAVLVSTIRYTNKELFNGLLD